VNSYSAGPMSETHTGGGHGVIEYQSPAGRSSSIARVGGALGIAGCCIGLLVFFAACAGFGAVMPLSLIPFGLGLVGFVLAIVGGVFQKDTGIEDTHVLASIFINIMAMVGGLVMMAAWRGWPIFFKTGGP